MLWPKKMHTRNLIRKKNSCGSKSPLPLSLPPPPPHNFSNGPSLKSFELYGERQRKRNCAINVYAALDQSAQEKWRTILSMAKRVIPCLHLISWKPLAFRIDLVTIFDAILTSRQMREKLHCVYEYLMPNNFQKTAPLKKIWFVN